MWFGPLWILGTLTTLIAAHGRITNITTQEGVIYPGWDPEMALQAPLQPPLAAWSAANLGNIFVYPHAFNTSNITCHDNAVPGRLHVNITAGHTIKLQWNEWPVSHKGPVLTYLAACNASCAQVDKNMLQWVKVDQQGWLNSTGMEILGGTWASDVLIANDFTWKIKIPEDLAEGAYVLRHEIIALHVADQLDGAQAYPQCVNLMVARGNASNVVKGIVGGTDGKRLYGERDKGILVDIHHTLTGYAIPGPPLWTRADKNPQPNENRALIKSNIANEVD